MSGAPTTPATDDAPPEEPTWDMRLEKLTVNQMQEAEEYSRANRPYWVNSLANRWSDLKAHVVTLSERADGHLFIIAGLHRYLALNKRGDKERLIHCLIYRGLTLEQEAELFHSLDTERLTHTAGDQVPAQRILRDPRILHIDKILGNLGLHLDLLPRRGSHNPRAVGAVHAVQVAYDMGGPEILTQSMYVIREAWVTVPPPPDQRNIRPFGGDVIKAIVGVLIRYLRPDSEVSLSTTTLIKALSRIGPRGFQSEMLLQKAEAFRNKDVAERAGMWTVVTVYNRNRPKDQKLDPDLVLRRVPWYRDEEGHAPRAPRATTRASREERNRNRRRRTTGPTVPPSAPSGDSYEPPSDQQAAKPPEA